MRTRSHPPTSAPHARESFAYAESPAPPIPTNQIRLSANAGKGDQLLSDRLRRLGPGRGEHRLAHSPAAVGVVEQRAKELRDATELGLGDDDRAAGPLEVVRVLRLMVARRVRIRDEDGRDTRGGELPDRAAGARDGQVGCAEGGAEAVRDGRST